MAALLRLTFCVLASISVASAQFPQLRGNFPHVIRIPAGGERIRIPTESIIRLPDQVRSAVSERMCCKAMTAQCLACAAGEDITQFCQRQGGRMPGCHEVMQKAVQAKRNRAIDGALTKVIEKTAGAIGGGQAQAMADKYLAQHPGVARQNLANFTGQVFGALEKMKHSRETPQEEPVETIHRRPASHHSSHRKPVAMPQVDDDEDDDEDDDSDEEEQAAASPFSLSNPWFIAGCALLITAISTGIAMGALCHARLGRSSREPLLSTLLAQEMETPVSGGHAQIAD